MNVGRCCFLFVLFAFFGTFGLARASAVGEAGFTLTLRRSPQSAESVVVASNALSAVKSSDGSWSVVDYRFPLGAPVTRATVRTCEGASQCRYRMSLRVADGWFLEKRSFPELRVPLKGTSGRARACLVGNADGGYRLRVQDGVGALSNGDSAGAFAATWDEDEGVYFGIEDARSPTRAFSIVRRAGSDEPSFSEIVFGWKTGEVAMDYDIVVQTVRRGEEPLVWTDFCDLYRRWDERQGWSARTLESRTDVPDWLRAGAAMTRFSRQWLEDPAWLERHLKW